MNKTVSIQQVDLFNKLSEFWWDEKGDMEPLHQMNFLRMKYIKSLAIKKFGKLNKLKILDIGCGGGILCEPLSRLGNNVTGIDAASEVINVAKEHAIKSRLDIGYENSSVEEFSTKHENEFDIITAMEIVEHVENVDLFMKSSISCLKRGGIMILSTINKTPKAYMETIIAAEYILKMIPVGTHSFDKFVKPSQISNISVRNQCNVIDIQGSKYLPIEKTWEFSEKTDVNYFMCVEKT